MPGLELHYQQLESGPAKVEIEFQRVGEVTVVQATNNRLAGGTGRVLEGQTLFLLCTHATTAHVYNDLPLIPGSLFIIRAGMMGRQTLRPGFGGIHFLLPDELLKQHQGLEPVLNLQSRTVMQASKQDQAALLSLHVECGRTSPDQARHLGDSIVSSLSRISGLESVSDLPLHLNRRMKLARQVRDFLENCPDLTLGDICAELLVSERTVRRVFAECFGMGTHQYQLTLRLNKVREALKVSEPCHGAVSKIATEHGFWHMGRFGTQYRRLFGETAKDTLLKSS
jgi:AraC-like DNA-binding protein